MKIKETKNGYSLKGLKLEHLEVIYSLLNHVTLGYSGPARYAGDLAIALEAYGVQKTYEPELTITLV